MIKQEKELSECTFSPKVNIFNSTRINIDIADKNKECLVNETSEY